MRSALWLALLVPAALFGRAPVVKVDHHQHLVGTSTAAQGQKPIDAKAMIAMLDEAGIGRAVLLSNGFLFDDYERVKAENDWTAAEAAKYPKRLVAFCGLNPLKDFALTEIARCAADKRFGRGIKLQFGVSFVDFENAEQVATVRKVFAAANENKMAIVVHMRTRRGMGYGSAEATIFLEQLLAAAPDVPVQIAHFCGGGAPKDELADKALAVFTAAIAQKDPRVKNLYFDTALVVPPDVSPARAQFLADNIRAIGLSHVLYGSDGGDPTDPPAKVQHEAFRKLPLSEAEFRAIEKNVAPYLGRR